MGDFAKDLKIGQKAQDFIIKRLQDELPGLKSIDGNFSSYDLVADSGYTIEVKFDRESEHTKNIAIEYEYDKHPSGLAKTKALEWLHIYYLDGWVFSRIKVGNLKAFIKNNWKDLHKTQGGDYSKAMLVLINKTDFANTFDFIKIPQDQTSS